MASKSFAVGKDREMICLIKMLVEAPFATQFSCFTRDKFLISVVHAIFHLSHRKSILVYSYLDVSLFIFCNFHVIYIFLIHMLCYSIVANLHFIIS